MRAWLLLISACGSSAPPAALANRPPEPAVDSNVGDDLITFSRDDDCLDHACPTYRVTIHPDGRIEWLGRDRTMQQAVCAPADADRLPAVTVMGAQSDGTDGGVEAGAVAAAGEDADALGHGSLHG